MTPLNTFALSKGSFRFFVWRMIAGIFLLQPILLERYLHINKTFKNFFDSIRNQSYKPFFFIKIAFFRYKARLFQEANLFFFNTNALFQLLELENA